MRSRIVGIVLLTTLIFALVGCGGTNTESRQEQAVAFCKTFYNVEESGQVAAIRNADPSEMEALLIALYEPMKAYLTDSAYDKVTANSFLYTYRRNCDDASLLLMVDEDSITFEQKNENTLIVTFTLVEKDTMEFIKEETVELQFDDENKISYVFFYDTSFTVQSA